MAGGGRSLREVFVPARDRFISHPRADNIPVENTRHGKRAAAEAAALGFASVSVVQFQKLRVVLSSQLRAGERAKEPSEYFSSVTL